MDTDVVVVGAGLAGLRCATALEAFGLDVVVLEAADAVGGRIRTDYVDGFRVDRGFQLLNPAYPAVRRWVDVPALRLQPFGAGVAARTDAGLAVLGHPLRAPSLLLGTTRVASRHPREIAAALRWMAPLLRPRRGRSLSALLDEREDHALGDALDAAGVHGLLRTVAERFFAGVTLDDELTTSDHFALLLAWMFARGVPALPHAGMQALPEQLAAGLLSPVRTGSPVDRVEGEIGQVVLSTAGRTLMGRAVVVATGGQEASALIGVDTSGTRGVVTTWWASDTSPSESRLLHVDGRARAGGPLVNCAVVSRAAPSYAPPGSHLVQASALMGSGRETPAEAVMREHAGSLLGCSTGDWHEIARHEVPHALPAQPAPFASGRAVSLGRGVFVCGDHRDTASIQGALVSGQRAAEAIRAALGSDVQLSG